MDFRKIPAAKARGIRNNNPFNLVKTAIKWQGKVKGTDSRFETFATIQEGIRAGVIDIMGDIGAKKLNTIDKLINVFAPPFENDTTSYINYVSSVTGKKPNDTLTDASGKIDQALLAKIVTAIINKENGADQAKLIPANVISEGIASALNNPTAKKYIVGGAPRTKNPINKDYTGVIFMVILAGLIIKSFIK